MALTLLLAGFALVTWLRQRRLERALVALTAGAGEGAVQSGLIGPAAGSARLVVDPPLAGEGAPPGEAPAAPFYRRHDWRIARLAAVSLAVVLGARAVALFGAPGSASNEPIVWLMGAALLFGLATAGRPWAGEAEGHLTRPGVALGGPARWWSMLAAIGLGGVIMIAYIWRMAPQPALIAGWLLSQALWLATFLPASRLAWPSDRRRGWRPSWRLAEPVGVGALLVVAAVMRLWRNDVIPLHVHGDFASVGLEARAALAGRLPDFFGTGWYAIPVIGFWPSALSLRLFGDNLAGLNTWPALAGTLALAGLYLLTRELFGWRPALFATVLAAGDIILLHYSRVASYIDPVPFIVWSLFFIARGLRHGRGWEFAAGGILAGYAMHMYFPGRVVLPLLAGAVALAALWAPRRVWRLRGGLAVSVVGLMLTLGPSLAYYAQNPHKYNERTQDVLVTGAGAWSHTAAKYGLSTDNTAGIMAEQTRRGLLGFWRYYDQATQFGIQRPWLEPVAGLLLILGLGVLLWHGRRRPALLLVAAWLGGYLASNVITLDPPTSQRVVGATLPLAILCGLALERGLRLLPEARAWRAVALALGLAVVLTSATLNWRDYLDWATSGRTMLPRVHVARFLMDQPPAYQARVISEHYQWRDREFAFLLPGRQGASVKAEAVMNGQIDWPEEPTIFILAPEARNLAPVLQARYPQGRLVDGSYPPALGVFWAFFTR